VSAPTVTVPSACIEFPVEGRVLAYVLDCASAEDERRVVLDLKGRDVVSELVDALVALLDELDSNEDGSC
jgi:hypothetical protein